MRVTLEDLAERSDDRGREIYIWYRGFSERQPWVAGMRESTGVDRYTKGHGMTSDEAVADMLAKQEKASR